MYIYPYYCWKNNCKETNKLLFQLLLLYNTFRIKLKELREKARKVLKYEMGVKLSKNIYYKDGGDEEEEFEYDSDDRASILGNKRSKKKLERLRRKRATCAADLSAEKPILLERSRNKQIRSNNSRRSSGSNKKEKSRGSSIGKKKSSSSSSSSSNRSSRRKRNVRREFDFSGR